MEVSIYASLAGCPALCVPAGFHPEKKWPMGLQLVGPYGGDRALLAVGSAYESVRREFIRRAPPSL